MTGAIKGWEHKRQRSTHSHLPPPLSTTTTTPHPVPPCARPQMARISHPEVTAVGHKQQVPDGQHLRPRRSNCLPAGGASPPTPSEPVDAPSVKRHSRRPGGRRHPARSLPVKAPWVRVASLPSCLHRPLPLIADCFAALLT